MKYILTLFTALLFSPVAALHAADTSAPKPNILLILLEDDGAHLGYLGTPGLSTPNLDGLAKDGVLFRQCYVGYPVCSPSKACIYTGLYPHRNGLINNTENLFRPASQITTAERKLGAYATNQIKAHLPTLAEILHEHGYHMGVSGKLHVSPNEKFPCDEFIPEGTSSAASLKAKPRQAAFLAHEVERFAKPFCMDVMVTALGRGKEPCGVRRSRVGHFAKQ